VITRDAAYQFAWNDPVGFRRFLLRIALGSCAKFSMLVPAWMIATAIVVPSAWSLPGAWKTLLASRSQYLGTDFYFPIAGFLVGLTLWLYLTQFVWAAGYALARARAFQNGMNLPEGLGASLVEDVNKLCKLIDEPPIHKLELGGSHEITFSRRPQYRVVGPWQGVLVASVPLLGSCTRDRLLCHVAMAVLMSRRRYTAGFYWARVACAFLETFRSAALGEGSVFLRPIARNDLLMRWVGSRIDLLEGLLQIEHRASLLEADRIVARVLGKDAHACELVRHAFVEWRFDIRERTVIEELKRTRSSAPADLMETAIRLLAAPPTQEEVDAFSAYLRFAYWRGAETDVPHLHDRIHSLGLTIEELLPSIMEQHEAEMEDGAQVSALRRYFPEEAHRITSLFSAFWREEGTSWWEENAEGREAGHEALLALDGLHEAGEISPEEHALLVYRIRVMLYGYEATREEGLRIAEEFPEDGHIQVEVGRELLMHGDELGIEYLEEGMELIPRAAPTLCDAIMNFYSERGRREEFQLFETRRITAYTNNRPHSYERSNPTPDATFARATINSYDRKRIVELGRKAEWIERIWIVKREFDNPVNDGLHVVAVELGGKWRVFRKLINFGFYVERDLTGGRGLPEGDIFLLDKAGFPEKLITRLKKTPDALVYDRKRDGKVEVKK
jgi:hypothetical protein